MVESAPLLHKALTPLRLVSLIYFLSIAFVVVSCKSPARIDGDAGSFCDSLELEFERADAAIGKLLWRSVSAGGTLDSLRDFRQQWFERLNTGLALSRIDLLKSAVTDSLLLRRLSVTRKRILRTLLNSDPDISRIVDSLRPLALTDVASAPAAIPELDSGAVPLLYRRREVYHSLIGSRHDFSSAIVRLARLRNRRSQALGYNSLLDLNLQLSGVSRDELNLTLSLIDSATSKQYKLLLKRIAETLSHRRLEEADVYFYEYRTMNPFRRDRTRAQALDFALQTITDLGINIRFAPVFVDSITQLKGAPWLLSVHPPDDIRALYSTAPAKSGADDIAALLSRFGQSVQLFSATNTSYIFRQPSDPLWEASIGGLFSGLLNRRELQQTYARVPTERYEEFVSALADARLLRLRRLLALIHFELALYDNPNRDLQEVYAQVVGDILYIKPDKQYQYWSSRRDMLLEPATEFCRLYASLLSAQIYSSALREYGSLANNPKFGAYLRMTYFAPAAVADWQDVLLLGTGEKLDLNYFLEQYVR